MASPTFRSRVSPVTAHLQPWARYRDRRPGDPRWVRDPTLERGFSARPAWSGLGLSIVQAIAMAHGWTVQVTTGENGERWVELGDVNRVTGA
jgi:hypothetical protein